MPLAIAVVAAALGVAAGPCGADEQTAGRPLKAVLYDFIGNQFVGSVVWHTDNVASPGQPPVFAVRADIEIPDLGMALRLEMRRNEDETLAASHTVELVFSVPPDFPHGEIAYVPGILMKARETARGNALKGLSVKVADNFFLFGLSSAEADMKRNIQLIEEQSWIDVPIAYTTGKRADIAVEKATPGQHALAVLETSISRGPVDPLPAGGVKPWPIAVPAVPSLPQQVRQIWSWPPGRSPWALAPGQALPRPVLSEAIRIVSTTVVSPIAQKPPSWLRDVSTMPITATTVPPWPRGPTPDFRIPQAPGRFAGQRNAIRRRSSYGGRTGSRRCCRATRIRRWKWTGAVARRASSLRGACAHGVAGRCFIIRIDDPGVARHELAHCNGWQHPL
jgi:hypothetical protein